jgi:hypothetical protein
MLGKAIIRPTPFFMFATSISESSVLPAVVSKFSNLCFLPTYGKYKSVFPGKTRVLALIACMAALKSPLYGS